jgi:D-tyrosyl-tRNA(Tyr) deacylase
MHYLYIMKALIQRVGEAAVKVDGAEVSRIGKGFLIFLGVENGDGEGEVGKLAKKCAELRIFQDDRGKMNLSVMDIKGEALVVSQFTLSANCKKGRRPSFEKAANPILANEFYKLFCGELASYGIPVKQGVFAAHMDVGLVNDGPVTIMLATDEL